MIPDNRLSTKVVTGEWFAPDTIMPFVRSWNGNENLLGPVDDWELGGINIADTSIGLINQNWHFLVTDSGIDIIADNDNKASFALPSTIYEISGSFDIDMNYALVYSISLGSYLFWNTIDGPATLYLGQINSPRLCFDNKRKYCEATSDLVLFYISGNNLCYRQQRDSFEVEHILSTLPENVIHLGRVGLTDKNRVQIELLTHDDVYVPPQIPGIGCPSDNWNIDPPFYDIPWSPGIPGLDTWGSTGCLLKAWDKPLPAENDWFKYPCGDLPTGGSDDWPKIDPVNPTLPCPE